MPAHFSESLGPLCLSASLQILARDYLRACAAWLACLAAGVLHSKTLRHDVLTTDTSPDNTCRFQTWCALVRLRMNLLFNSFPQQLRASDLQALDVRRAV